MNIFVYGTLLDETIWQRIIVGVYTSSDAVLQGYARKLICCQDYPTLVLSPESKVEGKVYLAISEEDIVRLNLYEGNEYIQKQVEVEANGTLIPCITYLFKDELKYLISKKDWCYSTFSKQKADYIKSQGLDTFCS